MRAREMFQSKAGKVAKPELETLHLQVLSILDAQRSANLDALKE